MVAALAKPKNVRQILCIAPPDNIDIEKLINFFGNRKGSKIDLKGQSLIPRLDGSTTIIPATYWQSLKSIDVMGRYNELASITKIKFIVANEDEVLGYTDFNDIDKRADLIRLSGNHDFSGYSRQALIDVIGSDIANRLN